MDVTAQSSSDDKSMSSQAAEDQPAGQSSRGRLPPHLQELWQRIVEAMQVGRIGDAANDLQRLLKVAPGYAPGWNNLGVALRRMQLWEAAEASFRRGLALPGGGTEIAWSNYGNALRDNGRFRDAERAFQNAIKAGDGEGSEGTRYNYSLLLRDMNRLEEALKLIIPIIANNPENGQYQWDYSLMLLQTGNWDKGFPCYENRWKLQGLQAPRTGQPVWNNEDLEDKTLVLLTEQGMGDSIHFSRYIPQIPLKTGKLIIQVRKPLVRLFQMVPELKHAAIVADDQPIPKHDYHLPIGSLPGRVNAKPDAIPAPLTFQVPDTMVQKAAASFPERRGRRRIGFIWAGSPGHKNDRNRSCRIEDFLPLLSNPAWDAYSFQVGPSSKDLGTTGAGALCSDLSGHIYDFLDTAAYLKHIDLLVAVDTGPAHLAGSLGIPTVILTPEAVDWRWGIKQSRTPWYKSVTLIHQDVQGNWPSAFAKLYKFLSGKPN